MWAISEAFERRFKRWAGLAAGPTLTLIKGSRHRDTFRG
jgi:hypothetical protein